jgi:hypothetical protein
MGSFAGHAYSIAIREAHIGCQTGAGPVEAEHVLLHDGHSVTPDVLFTQSPAAETLVSSAEVSEVLAVLMSENVQLTVDGKLRNSSCACQHQC